MIEIKDKKDCCGCWACKNVCPVQCISMPEDEEGFRYPTVDKDKCINCHLCEKVCPIIHAEADKPNEKQRAYLLQHKDKEVLLQSASGGAFTAIASWVIRHGGVVFGAAYDKDFQVVHQYVETEKDLQKFRNSKYVQSYTGDALKQVKDFLKQGRMVCYSGTPCQLEGLLRYLRKPYDNLITIDLLCHGVASPRFWHLYLVMLENIKGEVIVDVKMRDKKYGWLSSDETYTFSKSEMHRNTFYSLYYSGYISRESCFQCPYANKNRVGDITIGDYHGWNKSHTQYADDKGMSLVIVNSLRGKNLLNSLFGNKDVYCEPTEISDSDHVALTSPAKRAENYVAFWSDFNQHGVKYVCKKYGDMSWRTQLHIKLHNLLAHK